MACFIVPTTEAIVTTIVKKKADKNHKDGKEQNMFIEKWFVIVLIKDPNGRLKKALTNNK